MNENSSEISIKSFSLDDVIGKLGPPVEKSIVLFVIDGFDLVMEKIEDNLYHL